MNLDRRQFLAANAATALSLALSGSTARAEPFPAEEWAELGVPELRQKLLAKELGVEQLVRQLLSRIEAIDRNGPTLRSIIELNPDALATAKQQDGRPAAKSGPLHGIPVLLKDNIATADKMETTAGSLALVGLKPKRDAGLVRRLRNAGAVILGKTNLSEWANFRSTRSTSGWSARGGLTRHPYILGRNPSGSSSGSAVAVAAGLAPLTVGTETSGSIISPSSHCGIVGIKPTVGLVSRAGIIPISHTQDTAGPMTRTVADAAVLLTAMAGSDPDDPATADADRHAEDYSKHLDEDGLKGARIGVARRYFGFDEQVDELMEAAIDTMKRAGAVIVDDVSNGDFDKARGKMFTVMLYEFKDGLNKYLQGLGPDSPIQSLADLIAYNKANADKELPYFGQEIFEMAEKCGPLSDEKYQEAVKQSVEFSRQQGIDKVMDEHKLDALIAPSNGPAARSRLKQGPERGRGGAVAGWPAAAGCPHITVPAGYAEGLPIGLSFFGRAWSEPVLIRLAYAYERLTQHRKPPQYLPQDLEE